MFEKCGTKGKECTYTHCYCRCCGWGLLAVALLLLGGLVVQLLWNALIPDILSLGAISYLQALGLLILARLLFGSIGHRHGYHGHGGWCGWGKKDTGECGDWKHYDAWWDDEGKEAFKRYAEGKQGNKDPKIL